jgi:hypothetical protein
MKKDVFERNNFKLSEVSGVYPKVSFCTGGSSVWDADIFESTSYEIWFYKGRNPIILEGKDGKDVYEAWSKK